MRGQEPIERYLREHERAFRRLTENATEVFWARDPDREGTVYVNRAFEAVWGRPREQLYAEPDVLIASIHPEDRGRVRRAMERKVEVGEFEETYRIVRPDGDLRWIHDRGFPVYDSTGDLDNVVGIAADVTDRVESERELRRQRERTERLLDTVPVTLLVLDGERTITFGNQRAAEVIGAEEIAGTPLEECPWELLWEDEPAPMGKRPFDIVRERGEPVYDMLYRARVGGEIRWLSINGAPLFENGEFVGGVFATEDVTGRKRRERSLEALHEATRAMMRAGSVGEVLEIATETASDLLGLAGVAGYRFDAERGALTATSQTPAASEFVEPRTTTIPEPVREAFEEGTTIEAGGLTALPLGEYGVLAVFGSVDGEARSLARALCDDAEAALDRADREATLRARRERLRRTNAELERLNRVVDLVRDVTAALVRAGSREEIETTVCERLAAAGPYRLAWIDEGTAGVDPTARAGNAGRSLAAIERATERSATPTAEAIRTGEAVFERLPEEMAVVAVPLSYRGRSYGALGVYADGTELLAEDERAVLRGLGETIGYAIDAIETRTALASDGVTRLEFALSDPDSLPIALAVGGHLDHRGVVPGCDDTIRWFLRVDSDVEDVEAAAANRDGVVAVHPITTDGPAVIECVISAPCLLSPFVDHGVTITSLHASSGGATITAETASESDVRRLCETLEAEYGVELVGRQDLERPPRTPEERRSALTEELTERQSEILRLAHANSYFETPRRVTGAELAERLDINRSTFHRTLRAAERATLDALFD
ncbi:MAG: bacterio-opsin activator domain-containing protein [Halalkalicoccus sp.]